MRFICLELKTKCDLQKGLVSARHPKVNFSQCSVCVNVILVSSLCLPEINPCEGI